MTITAIRICLVSLASLVLTGFVRFNSFAAEKASDEIWWSLKPLKKPIVPNATDTKYRTWPRTALDQFILAKLLEKGFHPSPPADKRALLRRVYFDLTGLPPT